MTSLERSGEDYLNIRDSLQLRMDEDIGLYIIHGKLEVMNKLLTAKCGMPGISQKTSVGRDDQ